MYISQLVNSCKTANCNCRVNMTALLEPSQKSILIKYICKIENSYSLQGVSTGQVLRMSNVALIFLFLVIPIRFYCLLHFSLQKFPKNQYLDEKNGKLYKCCETNENFRCLSAFVWRSCGVGVNIVIKTGSNLVYST